MIIIVSPQYPEFFAAGTIAGQNAAHAPVWDKQL
jgi:hypothetical protein